MPNYEVATTIDAPIDVVWRVLTDVERMPQWTTTMRAVQLLDGDRPDVDGLGRGSRVRIDQPWLPVNTWVVDLFDPPRYFSWRTRSGLVETTATHALDDLGHATRATLTIQHAGVGGTLLGPVVMPLSRRYVNREIHGLKAQAESASG